MPEKAVKVKEIKDPANAGILEQIESAIARIRDRAYELFENHGRPFGDSLENWLRAERDLFEVPDGELTETATGYRLDIAAPGYAADQFTVAVDGNWITIQAVSEQPESSKALFRRFEFPGKIDAENVKAAWNSGGLTVSLPMAVEPTGAAAAKAA
jgi:HSP20 family molecular chaperone IbpA